MMKSRAFKALSFVFIICSALIFGACEPIDRVIEFFADDGTGHIFRISLEYDPKNLDPQLCNDESSVVIAKNLFSGLMDYDAEGRLIGRMADDYAISADGLVYTFYLKDGYKWHALGEFEAPVTAHDFVFGFRRLMDPKTASPHSEKYFCINGAEAARKGEISPDEIGVAALDDLTVQFTLEYPNAEFLYLLAELPAMPCCEEFFNTAGGKYGLEAEAMCSNGPFYVRYWLHDPYGTDNYVRLRRNSGYSDVSYVSPAGINYLITPDEEERKTDFSGGATDAIVYPAGSAADISGESYIAGYADTVGIIFNEKNKTFANEEVRQAFSWAIDREALKSSAPEILLSAEGIIPAYSKLSAKGYSPRIPEDVGVSNRSMAEYKWSFIITEREKSELIGMTILVPSDFEYVDYLNTLTDSWYSAFNIHFGLEIVNQSDYQEKLADGDYDIAIVSMHSDSANAIDYLKPFGRSRTYGISVPEVITAEADIGRYSSMIALNYACSEAENAVLSAYHFIPVWHVPTILCYDDDADGLTLDPFSKTVFFENARSY